MCIHYRQSERICEVRNLLAGHDAPRWMCDEADAMEERANRTDPASLSIWMLTSGIAWAKSTFEGQNFLTGDFRARQFKHLDYYFQNDLFRSGFLELLDYHGHEHVVGLLMYRAQKGLERLVSRPWYFKETDKSLKYQSSLNDLCVMIERLNNIGKR